MKSPKLPKPLSYYIVLRIRTYIPRGSKLTYCSGQISVNFSPSIARSMRLIDPAAMQAKLLKALSTKYPELNFITKVYGQDLLQIGTWIALDIRATTKSACIYFGDL